MFAQDENITENQKLMAQLKSIEKDIVRTAILKDKKRIDGRGLADVRQSNVKLVFCLEHTDQPLFTEVKPRQLLSPL